MIECRVTFDGVMYRFEVHPYPSEHKLMVDAPGVVPFDVDDSDGGGIERARDILRSAYARDGES